MAQEPRRFIIHVSFGGESEEETPQKESSALSNFRKVISSPGQYAKTELVNTASKMYKSDNNIVSAAGVALYAGTEISAAVVKTAIKAAEYGFDRYCTLQEDYMAQQNISNAKGAVDKAKGLGNSIISGVISGAAAGGVGGAIVGGVVGALKYGNDQYLEYQSRMSSYYQKLNSTNFETNFSASRLGLTNNSRGTEN